ncbi:GIY-YIG nuclease family protein [Vibrio breoganii]
MDLVSHNWSNWYPLEGGIDVYRNVPNKQAGIYRIRATQIDELIYIGQTGRCLRERLRALHSGVYSQAMPYNDPHTAAPNLWVWRQEASFEYEFSFLTTNIDTAQRQGLEDYFLWRHRQEKRCSTLCNYGRFHRLWIKPSNKKQGRAGKKLEDGEYNPAGLSSSSPLQPLASSFDENWMCLTWSKPVSLKGSQIKQVPKQASIYRLLNANSKEVIYIGETKNLANRLRAHARADWGENPVCFSFVDDLNLEASHLRHEIEVDLIGAFFEELARTPLFQYRKRK